MSDRNTPVDMLFAKAHERRTPSEEGNKPWKIMIVDDEQSMHEVTTLALRGVRFQGRELAFIHCYSGVEAKKAILEHTDTALMLLDVVMESEYAGLEVASFVRREADNQIVRIVLRTGQPGQAPERKVIAEFDINDYKEKTELTASKLFTLIYSCLRAYRDLETIERSKRGLLQVIDASADVFKLSSVDRFATGVLEQLTALLHANRGALYLSDEQKPSGLAIQLKGEMWQAIAGTGVYRSVSGKPVESLLSTNRLDALKRAREERRSSIQADMFVGYFEDRSGHCNMLLVDGVSNLDSLEQSLVDMFTRNVSIAFENVFLHTDIEETQSEIVYMLGEAVEKRSRETGNHVKRVAQISKRLALEIGMSTSDAEILCTASPLHDLGKIAIPDEILNKPGAHTKEEQEIMRTHAEIGFQMLRRSNRRVLQAAATIAHEHHERWDGAGYPRGLAGEDIHIYGRITAVADVFDALGSDRCYKKAWSIEQIQELFHREKGKMFDPKLVDILLSQIADFSSIREQLPD